MPCCSSCFRSSLRQPKVPVTLEILQSITLSSAHLHARRKWKSQYKYLLAYVIKCISTQRQIFMKCWHIVSANHNLLHVCVDLRCTCIFQIVSKVKKAFQRTHIQRILYNYYNKSKLAIRDIMHLSGFFLFGYLFNTCMLLLRERFIYHQKCVRLFIKFETQQFSNVQKKRRRITMFSLKQHHLKY